MTPGGPPLYQPPSATTKENLVGKSKESARQQRYRRHQKMVAGEVHPPHGKLSTYTGYMCRCELCKKAASDNRKNYVARPGNREKEYSRIKEWLSATPPEEAENRKRRWTNEEVSLVVERIPDGLRFKYRYTAAEAADLLGRTRSSIYQARQAYGTTGTRFRNPTT